MDRLDPNTRKLVSMALMGLDAAVERLRRKCDTKGLDAILKPLQERVDTIRRAIVDIRYEAEELERLIEDAPDDKR